MMTTVAMEKGQTMSDWNGALIALHERFDALEKDLRKASAEMSAIIRANLDGPQGEWIDRSGGIEGAWHYCSVCEKQAIELYDFCPNCGARMKGADDE